MRLDGMPIEVHTRAYDLQRVCIHSIAPGVGTDEEVVGRPPCPRGMGKHTQRLWCPR